MSKRSRKSKTKELEKAGAQPEPEEYFDDLEIVIEDDDDPLYTGAAGALEAEQAALPKKSGAPALESKEEAGETLPRPAATGFTEDDARKDVAEIREIVHGTLFEQLEALEGAKHATDGDEGEEGGATLEDEPRPPEAGTEPFIDATDVPDDEVLTSILAEGEPEEPAGAEVEPSGAEARSGGSRFRSFALAAVLLLLVGAVLVATESIPWMKKQPEPAQPRTGSPIARAPREPAAAPGTEAVAVENGSEEASGALETEADVPADDTVDGATAEAESVADAEEGEDAETLHLFDDVESGVLGRPAGETESVETVASTPVNPAGGAEAAVDLETEIGENVSPDRTSESSAFERPKISVTSLPPRQAPGEVDDLAARPLDRNEIIVSLKNGNSFQGVLRKATEDALVLKVYNGEVTLAKDVLAGILPPESPEYLPASSFPEGFVEFENGNRLWGRILLSNDDRVILDLSGARLVFPRPSVFVEVHNLAMVRPVLD